ncbi:RNA-binding S4 domain-containing protein [Pengzhenrongella sicca]|uniref:RNA-binding S4 domain-containing protein n=1 Tax=Pengzhenrongella sicca TaxID=2819238 RepID=A0A8A4ZF96_9MICO|nr:RNA-binding S4 domain-containing protein [Pengzhenrongella sicca]QTE30670.1 RNA-binding S4 domain-containing protein [Pengzhenrongella sicca]
MTDAPVPTVQISSDIIRLGQFLKLAGLAESGAHARELIEDGSVTVNGEAENRRGRQLRRGDEIELDLPDRTVRALVG